MLHPVDLVVVLALGLGLPILGRRGYARFRQLAALGEPGARVRAYHRTIAWQWSLAAALTVAWLALGRPLADLGFRAEASLSFWLCLGAVLVACTVLALQALRPPEASDVRERLRRQLARVADLLPHDRTELRAFRRLAVTAGICEELAFRGYLIWVLDQLTNAWLAALGAAVLFALAHAYQGLSGMVRILAAGVVAGTIFVASGAVWLPMLLHAVLDLASGELAHAVLADEAAGAAGEPEPAEA